MTILDALPVEHEHVVVIGPNQGIDPALIALILAIIAVLLSTVAVILNIRADLKRRKRSSADEGGEDQSEEGPLGMR